jgi:hypothetical protein
MTEGYCEKWDMDASGCAHCRGNTRTVEEQAAAEEKKLAAQLQGQPGWIEAQYGGRCATCGEPFKPGLMIKFSGPNSWTAQCCADKV